MARKATKSEPPAAASSPAADDDRSRRMFYLTAEQYRLLDIAALVDGMDASAILGRLIDENLSQYYAGRRDRATLPAAE